MLAAYAQMMDVAYAALLHHGVNYRTLRNYKRRTLLTAAAKQPLHIGQPAYIKWCGAMESDIRAAIRRKNLEVHTND